MIFATLNYPNIDNCIDNVTVSDYSLLVSNFTMKVRYEQNRTDIPSLLAINFGIYEIFASLNYQNIDNCIDNVTVIDYSLLVSNFTMKVKYQQN